MLKKEKRKSVSEIKMEMANIKQSYLSFLICHKKKDVAIIRLKKRKPFLGM